MVKTNLINRKKMKTLSLISILTAFIILSLVSCKDDDDTSSPVISDLELGLSNSKTGYLADDLHVQATVVAKGTIHTIEVIIHPEDESSDAVWEYDSVYTEFSGLKNTTFHKHIDISADADTGDYHFHFTVTDMEGYQTTLEEDLKITIPTDTESPVISVSTAPSNGETFSNGSTIAISGTVSDNIALGGLYIGLVRVDQNLEDADVNATNTITLLHTHDFKETDTYSFTASITVGAAQDNNITPKDITGDIAWQSASYYIVVKCKDAYGANWTFSDHYPISINL
jgi:hypothetical protein